MKRETVEEFLKRGGVIEKCPEDPAVRFFPNNNPSVWTHLGGAVSLAGEPCIHMLGAMAGSCRTKCSA